MATKSTRDEAAYEAGRIEANEWYRACITPKVRRAATSDDLAVGFDLRRVRGPLAH